jgi:uncharacterized protein (UPF0276 family)
LRAGLGLKTEHYDDAARCRADGMWFEVHAENYMVVGGPRRAWLEAIRREHPLSLHGVSLSLAGAEPIDAPTLGALASLVRELEPALVSEHLAWSRFGADYLPDLLPFPRTQATLQRVCEHVAQVQDAIGRPIAIENPSHYLRLEGHELGEVEFLSAIARRTGCSLLLDINNVHVSAVNTGAVGARLRRPLSRRPRQRDPSRRPPPGRRPRRSPSDRLARRAGRARRVGVVRPLRRSRRAAADADRA